MEMAAAPPDAPAGVEADRLAEVLGRLRRSLRRRVRESGPFPPLHEAQLELIRLLSRSPGIRVQQAAAALQLRSNTVSSLVAGLVAQGLVARTADPGDGRAVRLELTVSARRRLARWRDQRHAILGDALTRLDAADRVAVGSAIEVLTRLAGHLEESE
ncbi:MAG TPA: MarR family transcriptional regulator [Candidatus Dormibacteraeota bacterium]|nr:MarR family transcriptional regulator [Candidatus Dormibacteraeota bacterium]